MSNQNTPTSLSELSKELGVNKSTLQYYVNYGIFIPMATVGKMNIFDKKPFIRKFKEMEKLKKEGLSLEEVKIKLNEKNKKRKN